MSLRASCSHSVLGACSSLCVGWSSWFVLAVAGLLCSVVRDLIEWCVVWRGLPCDVLRTLSPWFVSRFVSFGLAGVSL